MQGGDAEFVREVQIQKPSRFELEHRHRRDDGPITLIGTLLMAMAGSRVTHRVLELHYTKTCCRPA